METSETPNIMKTKTLFLILISLTIVNCTHSPKNTVKDTDVKWCGLNGPVKYLKTELYKLILENDTFRIGEKINSTGADQNLLMEFNELGNLTSMKEFFYNAEISNETKYIYDDQDRLIKLRKINNNKKDSFTNYVFYYDPHDSITEVIVSSDYSIQKFKTERNKNNFAIKNQLFQNDTLLYTITLEYDKQNNIIAEDEYRNSDTSIIQSTERSFNKQNLVVKERIIEYQPWDTLTYENLYFYDANNKLVLVKEGMDKDSAYIEAIYRYHKNGELKETVVTPKGSSYYTVLREVYNEKGNLINRSRTPNKNRTKEIWGYKYKYDSNDNWIEKIEYHNGKPVQITKRTIEYY